MHGIDFQDEKPVILAGKALTPGIAMRLARALCREAGRGGFVPAAVLYMDGETLAWWVPPAKRHIASHQVAAHRIT